MIRPPQTRTPEDHLPPVRPASPRRRRVRLRTLFVADLKIAFRNKSNLLFAFLFPLIFMTLLGLAFGRGQTFSLGIGVIDHDHSELSRSVMRKLAEVPGVRLYEGSERRELAALKSGGRRLVIVIPAGFQSTTVGFETTLSVYEDGTDPDNTRIAMTVLQSTLSQMQGGDQLLSLDEHKVRGRRFRYLDFLAPGILGMGVQNLGVMGALGTLVVYRERGILRRIRVTPLPLWAFVGAQASVSLVLAMMQVFVIIGIAIYGFGVHVTGSFPTLVVLAVLGNAVFVNLGIIVSSAANTFQTANTLGLLVTLPMVFLSGVFYPTDGMPGFLQPLIKVLPLTHLVSALRDVVLRDGTLATVSHEVWILLGWGAALFLVALRAFRWE